MNIQIQSTHVLTEIEGRQVRVWDGLTESGTPCKVFVARLAVHRDHDASQFERELKEQLPPSELTQTIDLRHIL